VERKRMSSLVGGKGIRRKRCGAEEGNVAGFCPRDRTDPTTPDPEEGNDKSPVGSGAFSYSYILSILGRPL
jgi:hypothetical protein